MSCTTMYRLGNDPCELLEMKNSHFGAMYIWNDIAKRYFGLETFPLFNEIEAQKIWNAPEHHDMPDHDKIVLASTMDYATVNKAGLSAVIEAFKIYGQQHPTSHISDQCACLQSIDLEEGDVIAWCQTSLGEFWAEIATDDDVGWYDPRTGTDHFDIIEDM